MKDTVDASASVNVDPARVNIMVPTDFKMPEGGLNIRWPDAPLEQEARLHTHKLEAAKAFALANKLDQVVVDSPNAKLGIATCGKSYMDVRQAMQYLGIDDAEAARLGLRIYKVGMTWPLEPSGAAKFAEGLDKIIVVEEKRGLIEPQLKEVLYGKASAPEVVGKRDEVGKILFRSNAALDPNEIAVVIGRRLLARVNDAQLGARVAEQERLEARVAEKPAMDRTPYFCSGCPHNTGTLVPEGSRALAGIGCHFMAQFMDRSTAGYTQMGGEGASWIGEAPFVKTPHMFQNIGDGTYYHSGLLAVRAAAASGVNVTYKILYNDAVAMTGGQHVDGPLTVPQITLQVHGEGANKIAVVTDEPEKYPADAEWAPGVTVHHRDNYDQVQGEVREIPGLSVILYDQTCAAEKRRRGKRNQSPDPAKRAFINDLVCEGCGDCGVKSNCVSVLPLETEFGRKRMIDQSSCNKDFSCVKGFCPSFVTVHGGAVRKGRSSPAGQNVETLFPAVPEPQLPKLDQPYGIMVTGMGRTGVRTITKGVGEANAEFVDATRMATALMGDSIATNLFMLGYAFQKGLVPVSSEAINKAIELNGAAVKMNQAAFQWGRRAAVDVAAIERLIAPKPDVAPTTEISRTLEETVARRVAFLTGYQDAAYAQKYRNLVERVKQAESSRTKGLTGLPEAVARYYFKLLAYKDEYEVARLYADPAFMQKIKSQFEGDYKLHFHLAPTLLAKRDPCTAELRKAEYGSWVFTAFKLLSKLRGLRGTSLDIFDYTQERRMERRLIVQYEATIEELVVKLNGDNHALAVRIASIPEEIRGYGHVKERNLGIAKAKQADLLAAFRSPDAVRSAA